MCKGLAGTGAGVGHVIQGAQLGYMYLDRQNWGTEHTGEDLRESDTS